MDDKKLAEIKARAKAATSFRQIVDQAHKTIESWPDSFKRNAHFEGRDHER